MAVNKVVYGGNTLIDISGDTVTAEDLVSGKVAHDKAGNAITGTLTIQTFRTGSSAPANSVGVDGDWFLVTE